MAQREYLKSIHSLSETKNQVSLDTNNHLLTVNYVRGLEHSVYVFNLVKESRDELVCCPAR